VAARAKSRQYPTAEKLKAIKHAEGGEGVLPVAHKLGISRKLLHDWIKAWKVHGPEGLNRIPSPLVGEGGAKRRMRGSIRGERPLIRLAAASRP
jgi:transposase-like protein